VTFKWFTNGTCNGTPAATSTSVNLSGGVADGTGFTQTPSASGSYSFQATYSGDGTYNGSTGVCEPFAVAKIASNTPSDIHHAAHQVVTALPAGTTAPAQATATAALHAPPGTVTFKWFTNGTCNGTAADTSGAFALSGGIADGTTFTKTPVAAGSYSF